ncbi:MAG: hypothetical protein WAM53_01015 [Terrimicrobiaceae bacterium]
MRSSSAMSSRLGQFFSASYGANRPPITQRFYGYSEPLAAGILLRQGAPD